MKRGPYLWLSTVLALAGLLMSSTMIAWAAPCADDCPSMQQTSHSCCHPDEPLDDGARISAPACCGHEQTATCGSSAYFEPSSSSAAHTHSDAVAGAAGRIECIAVLPRPEPVATAPPMAAPAPLPATHTIVLLL